LPLTFILTVEALSKTSGSQWKWWKEYYFEIVGNIEVGDGRSKRQRYGKTTNFQLHYEKNSSKIALTYYPIPVCDKIADYQPMVVLERGLYCRCSEY
jgi:hypothetical protein